MAGFAFAAIRPLVLFWALMGVEAGATLLLPSVTDRMRSGTGALRAASTSSKRVASGAKILASTSLRRVKCRTSSFGRAVMASVKWVTAGKMSMGCSGAGPLGNELVRLRDEVRGGLIRVCRTGCALRFEPDGPEGASAAGGLAVFMIGRGEVWGLTRVDGQ